MSAVPLLSARGVTRDYPLSSSGPLRRRGVLRAVRGVDVDVAPGEVVALIGESGSGKSTLVRILLALDAATAGTVAFEGRAVRPGGARSTRWLRRRTGIVLQDPYGSLDPRMTVGRTVAEPLRALRIPGDHRAMVEGVLERVGLSPSRSHQYPHELSGGQRQRVALARAIVHGPTLLVGDEPLSALDVTVRAQVLDLLRGLHAERGTALLLVSHDIGLVQNFADRVLVMHDGAVVEEGSAVRVLGAPRHPYTRELVSAVPVVPGPPAAAGVGDEGDPPVPVSTTHLPVRRH
jgi:peptide/nickel transport system ATP-binding protein